MVFQRTVLGESLTALYTRIWLFACMQPSMLDERIAAPKALCAVDALEGSFAGMHPGVLA